MFRYSTATIVEPYVLSTDKWADDVYEQACTGDKCRIKVAKTVLAKYDPRKFLLSHCTIIAAVDTELADPNNPKSDYYIHPSYSQFVNNNGDCWSKKLLKETYRTFIGCNNYVEHVQIPSLSKGKVIDAVLREIPVGKDNKGNELTTYYVDILVATDRSHKDLVAKIESGETSRLSMGCSIAFSVCTKCGNKAVDETQACQHIKYEKNNMFFDDNGVQRKTAELCGHSSDPSSVTFVDASWVRNPAFVGAVKRNNIYPSSDVMSKLEEAFKKKGYQVKEGDFLKAAAMILLAQAKKDDPAPEPEEKAEAAPEDSPPEATSMDEPPPAEGAPPAGEAPAEGAPAGEAPAEGVPAPGMSGPDEGGSDIKKFKNMVKQKLLKQLGDEITDEFSKEDDEGAPRELETLDESIIKPASVQKVWSLKNNERAAYHKIGSHLAKLLKEKRITQKEFERLRYGSYMVLASKDLAMLANYGYKKRDFLALLSYLDSQTGNPFPVSIKKAIAKMGGSNGKAPSKILMDIVSSIGRKVTRSEGSRSLMWVKLLDRYEP